MPKLLVTPDGTIKGLYTECIDLSKFGKLHVTRASHVEFDSDCQEWVVTLPDGKEIYRNKSREKALLFEKDYFESRL